MSYKKKWNDAVQEVSDLIEDYISEQIQEAIAWQTDGYEFAEHLEGDDYIQFATEVRVEIIKKLNKGLE